MDNKKKDNYISVITGSILILNFYLIYISRPTNKFYFVTGLILLFAGLLLFIISVITLRSKNKQGQLVTSSIYAIIRHPMYLGGMLMFLSHLFIGQHWLIFISSSLAILCIYQSILIGETNNKKKFGKMYTLYMNSVPRINFFSGIILYVKTKKS